MKYGFSVATAILGSAAMLLASSPASAAPPTKDECVEAHSRGQDARDKGQLVDSKRLFLLCAQASCPALVQSDCAKFGDELSRTLPSVTFVARDGRGGDLIDTQVFVDGVLTQSRLDEGRSHDIDPGKHTVRFVHAGKDVTQTVVISAGERGRALTAVFDDGNATPPVITPGSTSPTYTAPEQPSRSVVPLIVAGAGGVALVVGVILIATGIGGVPDTCSRSSNSCAAPEGDPVFGDAKSAVQRANLGIGIGIAGAVVAGAGLVWYFASSPTEPEKRASAALVPWSDGHGGGAAWNLRF